VSVESEDSPDSDSEDSNCKTVVQTRPPTSATYLEIIHHPHSGISEPEYIFRDLPVPEEDLSDDLQTTSRHTKPGAKPWAPFRSRADFEFAEIAVQERLKTKTIGTLLGRIKNDWTDPGHTRVTFHDLDDYSQSLAFARKYVVQVCLRLLLYKNIINMNSVSGRQC
jgi:hypothetical protein